MFDVKFRIGLLLAAGLFAAGVLLAAFSLEPYTEDWLPVWVEQANLLVARIERHRQRKGTYPVELPRAYIPADLPGLVKVRYHSTYDKDGRDYFHLVLLIHFREALTYDSRGASAVRPTAPTVKTLGGWVYTRN